MKATVALAGKSSAPKRNNAARVFGYDVFISFALGPPPRGTHSYASDLARRLRERDFTVFFSEDEAAPGEQLDRTLLKGLLRSRTLVVVANRATLKEPRWVRTEIEEFSSRHPDRPIIPINVDGAMQDVTLAEQTRQWLPFQHKIWLNESEDAVAQGLASEELVTRLAMAPTGRKSNVKWRWSVRAVIAGLIVLACAATGFGFYARKQSREAQRQQGIAERNAAEAERQQLAAQRQATIAQTRLAETIHERGVNESDELDRPTAALLLEAEASATAPDLDPTRWLYRLRTLYLAIDQPQEVHQLGREIKWAIMAPSERIVTFSQLPTLDVWSTRTWKTTKVINVDPRNAPVTSVSPLLASKGDYIEVLAHEAIDAASTMGTGWLNLQQWNLDTGKQTASEREPSNRGWAGSILNAVPCRNPVSVHELEALRKNRDFEDVLEQLAHQKLDTLKSYSPDNPGSPSDPKWWIDALSKDGRYVLATNRSSQSSFNGTWNGTLLPFGESVNGDGATTAIFEWTDGTYHQSWILKEQWEKEFPKMAGFGSVGSRTFVWSILSSKRLDIKDVENGMTVRPPIWLHASAWVKFDKKEQSIWIVDEHGRVAKYGLFVNGNVSVTLASSSRISIAKAVFVDDHRVLTSRAYAPSSDGPVIARWDLNSGRSDWSNGENDHLGFGSANALAVSPSGHLLGAEWGGSNWFSSGGRLLVWNPSEREGHRVMVSSMLPGLTPLFGCPEGAVQFHGENAVVWTECKSNFKNKRVHLDQGETSEPVQATWTVRTLDLRRSHSEPIDEGQTIAPNESFLAFSKDGNAYLTQKDGTLIVRLIGEKSAIRLESPKLGFGQLAALFFRSSSGWHLEMGHLVARLPGGAELTLTGRTIAIERDGKNWTVHDPRDFSSIENSRSDVDALELIALSPSGRVVATASEKRTNQDPPFQRANLVRLWDTATGAPITSWLWHESQVVGAEFRSDGWLCTLTSAGKLRTWPGDVSELDQANWLDSIGEPVSGFRLNQLSESQPIEENELSALQRTFHERLQAKADLGDELVRWFQRMVMPSH